MHFDGHGRFGIKGTGAVSGLSPDGTHTRYESPSGMLAFENDDGKEDPIDAEKLGQLILQHKIPLMVLNACQSAMNETDSPFSSVAASLLRAGVRNVVAMSHSLWVNGARQFVPAFYNGLFGKDGMAEAMRQCRSCMSRNNERNTLYGPAKFNDWIIPVLYSHGPENYLPEIKRGMPSESVLPDDIRNVNNLRIKGGT